ncbi:MAG: class I SAM-dependent methyltransferase [Chloroflexi bacterium]|nr:MAG: class I SAM-dependent methyltransferase [Chloroflexota bacterium]
MVARDLEGDEARQQAHYDEIGEAYEAHYSDEWSTLYRRRFLYEPLLKGIDVRGKKVLDAMCGSGQTAEYLLSQGARAYGLDISAHVIEQFRAKLPGAVGVQGSILNSGFDDESFDAVFITGGLHHVHPKVPEAVSEIHRILKPGGWLCFYEPHAGSVADSARRFWYRHDNLFEANEAAVDFEDLMRRNAARFDFVTTRYSGGPAYLLVFNSMVFRVPLAWKRRYARPLLWLERHVERIQGKRTSCFAMVQWRKHQA